MAQKQCPWCGHLGQRYSPDLGEKPGDVGTHDCVCRHATCASRRSAILAGGRYYDGKAWVCLGGCGTAPPLTDAERDWAESE